MSYAGMHTLVERRRWLVGTARRSCTPPVRWHTLRSKMSAPRCGLRAIPIKEIAS